MVIGEAEGEKYKDLGKEGALSKLVIDMNKFLTLPKKDMDETSLKDLHENYMEKYHVFFSDLVLSHLVKDQQKERDVKLQTIIPINMELQQIEARGNEMEN